MACSVTSWVWLLAGLSFPLSPPPRFASVVSTPVLLRPLLSLLFPSSSCVCFLSFTSQHQSIFMFPLSFSSSSSLSSIPPSLDSISELDRGLSDISEDDDRIDDTDTTHTLWTLPSNTFSLFTDQRLADLEHLAQNPASSFTATTSQTCTAELLKLEEGCQAETGVTAGLPNWRSWFTLKGVAKYVSFILCFLSVSGNENKRLPISGLSKKLNIFTPNLFKLMSQSVAKLKTFTITGPKCVLSNWSTSKLYQILNSLAFKWTHFLAFFTRYLHPKFISFVAAFPSRPTQLRLPSVSSFTCPPTLSSFLSLSSLPFSAPSRSSLPPLATFTRSNLTASVHRYLLNPSPLFLPCLLVLFLLVVMLTASQSLVLALILATPLGLTLCYLESVVSSQRKTVLPMFISNGPNDQSENQSSSAGFNRQASPLTPTHTPPRIRHHAGATWTQEMCDPAA